MSQDKNNRYAGYFEAIELVKKSKFDPTCKVADQIYECICAKIIYITKAKISKNDCQENFLVMKCNFEIPMDNVSYLLPIHIMLNENTYPSFYPIVQVDLAHSSFMYNPSCTAVLSNGCVYIDMFRNWKRNYTLLQSLKTIQSIFQKTYPICRIGVHHAPNTNTSSSTSSSISNSGLHQSLSPSLEVLLSLKKENEVPIIPLNEIQKGNLLGSGAFSRVYEGIYKDNKVALKVYKSAPVGKDLVGFQREVSIQNKLKHPNIVQIYGLSYQGDIPIIVMELGGDSLKNKIDSMRPEDIRERTFLWKKQVALQIASAIQYMHELNYIHRDIKSDNIIYSNGQYKLTDFGLSREEDTSERMTYCGTPSAMAPELFKKLSYNEKVDIYSFGIVLYELFTEKHPYEDIHKADQDIIRGIAYQNLRPTLPHNFPYPEIISLIQSCWCDNCNDRPDISHLITSLNQFNPIN